MNDYMKNRHLGLCFTSSHVLIYTVLSYHQILINQVSRGNKHEHCGKFIDMTEMGWFTCLLDVCVCTKKLTLLMLYTPNTLESRVHSQRENKIIR